MAGVLSLIAAAIHVATILGGPDWYRFFGAGEEIATMAEQGSIYPAIITTGITLILVVWALYAFSGAGLIGRLPLLNIGLIVIAAIYTLRGVLPFPAMLFLPELINPFTIWSSLICCVYGVAYGMGTLRYQRQRMVKG